MKDQQAFPLREIRSTEDGVLNHEIQHIGMTLRDYFAGQALIGVVSNKNILTNIIREAGEGLKTNGLVILSYRIADAMLKEREI